MEVDLVLHLIVGFYYLFLDLSLFISLKKKVVFDNIGIGLGGVIRFAMNVQG